MNQARTFVPLSAFSPLTFTFRILERDFVGVAGPLFAAALLGQLHWLILAFGMLDSLLALVVVVVWIPISSWCTAGMLRFCLKVARGERYGYRDLWAVDASVLQLLLLECVAYACIAASVLSFAAIVSRSGTDEGSWLSGIPSLADALGTAGQVVACFALVAVWLAVLTRTIVAPVLIIDERVGAFGALARSVALTRGNGLAIFLYGIIIGLVGGMAGTMFAGAALSALTVPGIVYLGLAVRGELV